MLAELSQKNRVKNYPPEMCTDVCTEIKADYTETLTTTADCYS